MKQHPKSSIIISVYKDTDALDLILEALSNQTVLPNEVIVSEDGNSKEMLEFVKIANEKYKNLEINHLSQEDNGWKKNIALNKAIVASKYEYLIFIDGDCVPYSTFIEGHITNCMKKTVLCGKRIAFGPKISDKIKKRELKVKDIEKKFIWYIPFLLKDGVEHLEDGIYLGNSIFAKLVQKRYVRHIVGCNFSCYKEDFLTINGFDEDFLKPSQGEDVDPSWRFRAAKIELKSIRTTANQAHIYHEKRFDSDMLKVNELLMFKNKDENKWFCTNGIKKL